MSNGAIESNSKVNGGFAGAFCGRAEMNYTDTNTVNQDNDTLKNRLIQGNVFGVAAELGY